MSDHNPTHPDETATIDFEAAVAKGVEAAVSDFLDRMAGYINWESVVHDAVARAVENHLWAVKS